VTAARLSSRCDIKHQGEPEATDGQIAEILSISRRTVIRIKQRFVQGTGKWEAQLIHASRETLPICVAGVQKNNLLTSGIIYGTFSP